MESALRGRKIFTESLVPIGKAVHTPYVALLKACAQKKDLCEGIRVHADILRRGLLSKDPYIASALVSMYGKCGALAKAQQVLDELPVRNAVTWNALIAGYVQQGKGEEALDCFKQMQREGLFPNVVTFISLLKACGSLRAADKGKHIHDVIVSQGLLNTDMVLGNSLVDMYAKCGVLAKAQQVLDELSVRNVVSWNALIAGYARQGQGEEAINCYERMQWEGLSPDSVTFICVLMACGSIRSAEKGKYIHDEIVNQGLLRKDVVLGTALVDMYSKCGVLYKAQQVLDELPVRDIVSWNALIAGYAQHDRGEEALNCVKRMRQEGLSPDPATLACILKACGRLGAADKGKLIHDEIVSQDLLGKDLVLGTALVDMYAKCGALTKAQRALDRLPVRNVVSWSAIIAGHVQQGQGEEALNCFERMQCEGLSPNAVTFACILKACGTIGAADKGKQIHDEIVSHGLVGKSFVLDNALLDMYAKCGMLAEAQQVLHELPVRNVVSWNALIAGYAQQVQGEEALICFERMQQEGLYPDAVIFTSVLNACSRLGLVEEGQMYLANINKKHGFTPSIEHYTCLVDLFGRAGQFDKAIALIKKMPSDNDLLVWSALLFACRKWGNVELGRLAFEQAVQVDINDATAYVCMADIYAAAGMHCNADKIEAMRLEVAA